MVAAGIYNEALDIDKSLTIMGANAGTAGTDTRDPETILHWTTGDVVSLGTDQQVTFDGFSFEGKHVVTASQPDAQLAFTNSVFDLEASGNDANNFYFNQPTNFTFTNNSVDVIGYSSAFFQPVGDPTDSTHSTVNISGNTFTGHAGTYEAGADNTVALIANLSDVTGAVNNNTFSNLDIGVLVANGAGPLDITGNTFEHMHRVSGETAGGEAAGIVFYDPAPYNGDINISGNHFNDTDAGIRSSAIPGTTVAGSDIVIDGNTFVDVNHPGYQPIEGVLHFTNSTIDGAAQADIYLSGFGADTISGGAGAHYLYSNPENGLDTLVNFDGNNGDTIDFLVANFTGTSAGAQTATTFGSSADGNFASADERFHYNTSTNELSYDADGNGSGHLATVIAELDHAATITAANIHGV
jgi:hypothetical protein